MASVSEIVAKTTQPSEGFLSPTKFSVIEFTDKLEIYTREKENLPRYAVGITTDLLTRILLGASKTETFNMPYKHSLKGTEATYYDSAVKSLKKVKNLSDASITAACELTWYCFFHNTAHREKQWEKPNKETIENIRVFVKRSLKFFKKEGIQYCGYTVNSHSLYSPASLGEIDYLTRHGIFDLKVTASDLTKEHTLQLLLYYMLLRENKHSIFQSIRIIGIYNPYTNKAYTYPSKNITLALLRKVNQGVWKPY